MPERNQVDRRLVFKGNGEAQLSRVCIRNFWGLTAQRRGDPERQVPLELEFASEEEGEDIRLVYVDDPICECTYVVVSGSDKEKACKIIKEKTETWSDEEVLAAWREGAERQRADQRPASRWCGSARAI